MDSSPSVPICASSTSVTMMSPRVGGAPVRFVNSRAIHAASAGRINARLLRSDVEVLVEREEDGRSTGRARGGQLVHFNGTGLVGQLAQVTIDAVTPWSLQGRIADGVTLAVV